MYFPSYLSPRSRAHHHMLLTESAPYNTPRIRQFIETSPADWDISGIPYSNNPAFKYNIFSQTLQEFLWEQDQDAGSQPIRVRVPEYVNTLCGARLYLIFGWTPSLQLFWQVVDKFELCFLFLSNNRLDTFNSFPPSPLPASFKKQWKAYTASIPRGKTSANIREWCRF